MEKQVFEQSMAQLKETDGSSYHILFDVYQSVLPYQFIEQTAINFRDDLRE